MIELCHRCIYDECMISMWEVYGKFVISLLQVYVKSIITAKCMTVWQVYK